MSNANIGVTQFESGSMYSNSKYETRDDKK